MKEFIAYDIYSVLTEESVYTRTNSLSGNELATLLHISSSFLI